MLLQRKRQASLSSAGPPDRPQVREMTAANLLVEKAARSERLTVFKATLVRSRVGVWGGSELKAP